MAPVGDIKIGLFLTNQHPVGADLAAGMDDQLRMVREVRDRGWDSIWAGQHYLPDGMAMPQCVPFVSRVTAECGPMEVGIGILLLALHNPLDVAETWASIDVLCGGRLTFGVGLGYREVEYHGFGLDPKSKVRRFEANLDLVKRLWTTDNVDSDLEWCRLESVTLNIKPVQKPRPPIWIAANAHAAVERAARMGDAWMINPHATTETIVEQAALFRATRQDEGLPPAATMPAMREIYCAPTRALAVERAAPHLLKKYRHYADWGQDKALPGDEDFRAGFDELSEGRFIVGTPDDCLEKLLPWRDELDVDHFIFRTDWVGMPADTALQSIDLLDREVVPVLRAT
ncbi:MAG: LLM class flavin-dependent oxidoreductase [Acidimicrobiaceae bacterium]|nr:LLM class flavin-dependent oxidoreductase [Acidimicrobiaceae bacterium]